MRLFLIRHGQSESNVDLDVHKHTPDHAINLTKQGQKQAEICGQKLLDYLNHFDFTNEKFLLWSSPYQRTRQTSKFIQEKLKWPALQQFGLFDGLSDQELQQKYPDEWKHYDLCEKHQGRFWARMPLGESRFDVAVRVHQLFGTWQRDKKKHGIKNLIVVAHGTTNRAIVMQWRHKTPEWFEEEKNPGNCSIRLIEDNNDYGYIFGGFDKNGKEISL